jgi:hypothetical protein
MWELSETAQPLREQDVYVERDDMLRMTGRR